MVTGSLDCTCRIWNAGTGILLFQINVPSPVYKIHVDDDYVMTCICQNRILVFQIKIALKESDLPIAYLSKSMDVEESQYHLKRVSIKFKSSSGLKIRRYRESMIRLTDLTSSILYRVQRK